MSKMVKSESLIFIYNRNLKPLESYSINSTRNFIDMSDEILHLQKKIAGIINAENYPYECRFSRELRDKVIKNK